MTLVEIARMAGVSTATVSRIYNKKNLNMVGPDTRAMVEELLSKYNYHPNQNAKRLVTRKNNLIGFQVKSIRTPIVNSASLEALNQIAQQSDYGVLIGLSKSDEDEKASLSHMLSQGIAGLIWQPRSEPSEELMHMLDERHVKVLWFRRSYPGVEISLDEEKAGEIAARYLMQQGMERFYIICIQQERHSHLRLKGFQRALRAAGMMEPTIVYTDDYTPETIPDEVYSIIKPKVGIFSNYVRFAHRFDWAIKRNGCNDCKLCTVADESIAQEYGITIPLISPNASEIGETAFEMIKAMIDGEEVHSILLSPRLWLPGEDGIYTLSAL